MVTEPVPADPDTARVEAAERAIRDNVALLVLASGTTLAQFEQQTPGIVRAIAAQAVRAADAVAGQDPADDLDRLAQWADDYVGDDNAPAADVAALVAAYRAVRARVAEGTGGAGQGEPLDRASLAKYAEAWAVSDDASWRRVGDALRDALRAPGAVAAAPPAAEKDEAAVERSRDDLETVHRVALAYELTAAAGVPLRDDHGWHFGPERVAQIVQLAFDHPDDPAAFARGFFELTCTGLRWGVGNGEEEAEHALHAALVPLVANRNAATRRAAARGPRRARARDVPVSNARAR